MADSTCGTSKPRPNLMLQCARPGRVPSAWSRCRRRLRPPDLLLGFFLPANSGSIGGLTDEQCAAFASKRVPFPVQDYSVFFWSTMENFAFQVLAGESKGSPAGSPFEAWKEKPWLLLSARPCRLA